jgi:hypothetical protein
LQNFLIIFTERPICVRVICAQINQDKGKAVM